LRRFVGNGDAGARQCARHYPKSRRVAVRPRHKLLCRSRRHDRLRPTLRVTVPIAIAQRHRRRFLGHIQGQRHIPIGEEGARERQILAARRAVCEMVMMQNDTYALFRLRRALPWMVPESRAFALAQCRGTQRCLPKHFRGAMSVSESQWAARQMLGFGRKKRAGSFISDCETSPLAPRLSPDPQVFRCWPIRAIDMPARRTERRVASRNCNIRPSAGTGSGRVNYATTALRPQDDSNV